MRVPAIGGPRRVIEAALAALEAERVAVEAFSPILATAPLGPSSRRYANAAAVVASELAPPALLAVLHGIERAFGRRRRGARWRARPLDLDIVVWSGGAWGSPGLTIPHPAFRHRAFVLAPAAAIAPRWRDPGTGSQMRHLRARLTHPRRLPSGGGWSGP